jgi:hypothetical protein
LRRGLEENIGLVQAKSIAALLAEREGGKGVMSLGRSPNSVREIIGCGEMG